MKEKKKVSVWEVYLTKEIGIEFKACLYFFALLFLYCIFRIVEGNHTAEILHLAEMILTCYIIGYIQVYCFKNFDEAEKMGGFEIAGMLICTAVYAAVSYLGGWFYRNLIYTLIFVAYQLVAYICVFFIYKSKRRIDDKILNDELRLFQAQHKKSE